MMEFAEIMTKNTNKINIIMKLKSNNNNTINNNSDLYSNTANNNSSSKNYSFLNYRNLAGKTGD